MENRVSAGGARLRALFDAGTFVETGAYICREDGKTPEGVATGYGAVAGRLVFAFAQDGENLCGALDGNYAKKIGALYDKATSVGAPIVGIFDSAGALVFDGAAALAGYGVLLRAAAGAKGKVPQIAVIDGAATGTMAAFSALFDFTVVVRGKSKLYVSSPSLTNEKIGTAEYAFESGNAAILCESGAADAEVRRLLAYLPDAAKNGTPFAANGDDLNRMLPLGAKATAAEALELSADAGSFLPLYGGVAPEVKVGLAALGGVSAAVAAIDGALTAAGIEKMTCITEKAALLALPLVTFINCTGVAPSEKEEEKLARALAAWARAQVSFGGARVAAVVGSAIGAGFIFGASRTLGNDLVLALPESEIAALSAPAAVAFLWNDRIGGEVTREKLENEWLETRATPVAAAAGGEVDDVVEPRELRARIISAVYMLLGKK